MKQITLLFIGIVFALICLETMLQVSSFVIKCANEITNKQKVAENISSNISNKNSIKILCIGESTTFAQYPKQLVYFLDNLTDKKFIVIDCGVPGTNIKNIAERIEEQIKYYKPDIVVSMMGINDAIYNNKTIYKKYPIKILNLFVLIKRNIEELVVSKLYADKTDKDYSSITDKYFITGEKPQELINIAEKNPTDLLAIKSLISLYRTKKDFANIEKYAKLFFEHDKSLKDSDVLFVLTDAYIRQKKFEDAKNIISTIISDKNVDDYIKNEYFSKITESYIFFSDLQQTKEYYDLLISYKVETCILDNLYNYLKINGVKTKYYTYKNKYKNVTKEPNLNLPVIKNAYLFIAQQLIKNDIIYICMGYPTMSIEKFKTFFKNNDLENKIYFVSNEDNFKEELKKHSYYKIFRDNFAGNFGHCTDYGNEIIAKKLAKVISQLIN